MQPVCLLNEKWLVAGPGVGEVEPQQSLEGAGAEAAKFKVLAWPFFVIF